MANKVVLIEANRGLMVHQDEMMLAKCRIRMSDVRLTRNLNATWTG